MAALHILAALLYPNLGEWLMHKYLLDGLSKKPGSIWPYHCHQYHRICAEQGMQDPGYSSLSWIWNAQTKALAVLALMVTLHLPLAIYLAFFVLALYASPALYYYKHRRAHLAADWAKRHLPWFHYILATRLDNWTGEPTN